MRPDPKSTKMIDGLTVFFALLGSAHTKAIDEIEPCFFLSRIWDLDTFVFILITINYDIKQGALYWNSQNSLRHIH